MLAAAVEVTVSAGIVVVAGEEMEL